MKGLFSEKLSRSSSVLMQAIEKAVINQCRAGVPEEYKHLFNNDKNGIRRKRRKLVRSQTSLSVSVDLPKVKLELLDTDNLDQEPNSTKNNR